MQLTDVYVVRILHFTPFPRRLAMAAGKSKATSSSKTEGGDRDKAIKLALDQIERQFGKGSIMRLGESAAMDVDVIPSGAISLDAA